MRARGNSPFSLSQRERRVCSCGCNKKYVTQPESGSRTCAPLAPVSLCSYPVPVMLEQQHVARKYPQSDPSPSDTSWKADYWQTPIRSKNRATR
eukprot:13322872-Heterocapsa_arctica.AAC.1